MKKFLILTTLLILSSFSLASAAIPEIVYDLLDILEGENKDPLMISFWVIVGIATTMILTSWALLSKLKSLRKNQSAEEQEKETKLSDLKSRFISLQNESAKTKRDLAKAQNEITKAQSEISNLKDIETSANTEVRQLKESLGAVSKERDQLNKENAAYQETIPRQKQRKTQSRAQGCQSRYDGENTGA